MNSENAAARGQTRHVPLHSTIMHFPDARDRKFLITPYKKLFKIGHRDDEAVQFKISHPIQTGIHPYKHQLSTSLCLPIVPCADLSKCKKCEFCSVVFVVLFMSTSLTLALPLSQNFAQSWRTHQPNNSLLYLPKMVYSKANAPDQSLPETSKL